MLKMFIAVPAKISLCFTWQWGMGEFYGAESACHMIFDANRLDMGHSYYAVIFMAQYICLNILYKMFILHLIILGNIIKWIWGEFEKINNVTLF